MVRRSVPGDEPEWLRMRGELWPECDEAIHLHEMRLLLGAGAARDGGEAAVFVAEDDARDGTLHGFVELSVRRYAEGCHSGRVAYVEGWYVAAARRGAGVGAALMRAAEDWAAAQGCLEMASDAELANADSERAHRAIGFEVSGRLVHFRKWVRSSAEPPAARRGARAG